MKLPNHLLFLYSITIVSLRLTGGTPISPTSTTTAPAYQPTNYPIFQLSSDSQFAFYLAEVLALSSGGGSSTGELLRIATQIVPSDFESTYTAFGYMADQISAIAKSINVTDDPVGAREAYFRAATYYRGADFFLIGNQSDPRNYDLWDSALDCFNTALALIEPVAGERFKVKAHSPNIGDFEAIGIFYKASATNESRPTVVMGSGYDGSQEETYHSSARELLSRGLNVVTYEGPGQPTVRRQQNLGFIPDWWNVVTPVVDYLSTRPDVDMSKLVLVGSSFGGNLAPRAASREHRFSAVISNDGLPSMQQAIADSIPKGLVELYSTGNKTAFDEVMLGITSNTSQPTQFRWLIDQSLWAFTTDSPYDWWTRLGAFTWTNETVQSLPMPVFIGKGQDDTSTDSQPELAYQMLTTGRANGEELTYYHVFNTSLGAGEHCSLGAEAELTRVWVKWLSEIWGGLAYENYLIL